MFFRKKYCEDCDSKNARILELETKLKSAQTELNSLINKISPSSIEESRASENEAKEQITHTSEAADKEIISESDFDFIAKNLEQLSSHTNLYQCYWLRSHPDQPKDETLYDTEYDSTPLEYPLSESKFSERWEKIFLSIPIFESCEKQALAYRMLCNSLAKNICENSARETYHRDDKTIVELCKRFPTKLTGDELMKLISDSGYNFEASIQKIITDHYVSERLHLENLLEQKKSFILPKLLKHSRITYDEFGEEIPSDLHSAMSDILSNINISNKFIGDFKLFYMPEFSMVNIANSYVKEWLIQEDATSPPMPLDGWEFEHWVSQKLNENGWKSYVTAGSGDQGVDVVATRGAISIGIQCKRYSDSVGNKAVQEAFSGAKYMNLNLAAVLTNSDFTKSARALSNSTGVLLLTPEDIPTLFERISTKR